jgi:hypothetical protein
MARSGQLLHRIRDGEPNSEGSVGLIGYDALTGFETGTTVRLQVITDHCTVQAKPGVEGLRVVKQHGIRHQMLYRHRYYSHSLYSIKK